MGKRQRGFTIIEIMLFLAVTGALTVGILASAGVSIGQQRYRDSVNSLKSFLQQQYSDVTNVINDRGQDWACNASASVSETGAGSGQNRGTSDCVMLGRFITVNDTGTVLTAANIVGYQASGATPATSDLLELQTNYKLSISPINQSTQDVNWGARVVKAGTADAMSFSMLVVRSPLSGSLITFTSLGVQTDPNAMVTAGNMQETRNLCVNAEGGTFIGGKRLEVRIDPFATSQSAIYIPPESESVCD